MITGKNAALLLFSLIVSLALVEGGLRIIPGLSFAKPQPRVYPGEMTNRESRNFIPDVSTGWRMRPNHTFQWAIEGEKDKYVSDKMGFRVHPGERRSVSKTRIVLVGDSFTFGTGVSYKQTFGAKIEAALSGTTVYNIAMPGFGIDQMWMSIRHQALEFDPSLIVVGFVDQDFGRSLTAYRPTEGFNKPTFILDDDALRYRTFGDRPSRLVRELEEFSYIWGMFRNVARRIARHYPYGEWWHLNTALFLEMLKEARVAAVEVVFVRLPMKRWRRFQTLENLMAGVDANYLDLARPQARPPHDIHFKHDSHINEQGHEFVAQALLPTIRSILEVSQ